MNKQSKLSKRIGKIYWTLVTTAGGLLFSTLNAFAADPIWDKFSTMMQDFYGKILGVSTIVAVTTAAIALVIRMVLRNQRAVDEATTWLKRIVMTWVILNTLGFIVAYIQPLVEGGKYTGK
ncbi:MAG: hypothetical protein LBS96_08030 [Oscillospiraceae bacterium]|jgi:putative copper export protein|nr:hypothetical protein [Oscillospiraceae bacterium]